MRKFGVMSAVAIAALLTAGQAYAATVLVVAGGGGGGGVEREARMVAPQRTAPQASKAVARAAPQAWVAQAVSTLALTAAPGC